MLLAYTSKGLYCAEADVYIDPRRPVENAIITHAHSDHAKKGHKNYLAHTLTAPILKERLGSHINISSVEYSKEISKNGVKISLHPAGHIPGSAQVRLEYKGEVWVVSGDYKLECDGLSEPFEPVNCHTFITESTFAHPMYKWQRQTEIFDEINLWWKRNIEAGKLSILTGYSLGKAQRLFKNVDHKIGKIHGHGTITSINNLFRSAGLNLPELETISEGTRRENIECSLIIAPPSVIGSGWPNKLIPYSVGYASGWMLGGKGFRRNGIDKGFAISDHADWDALNLAVKQTGAENIYVTHGFTANFINWLRRIGYNAFELKELGDTQNYKGVPKQLTLFDL